MAAMPALTRHRSPDHLEETWCIFLGHVRVGIIARRAGAPPSADRWTWIPSLARRSASSSPNQLDAVTHDAVVLTQMEAEPPKMPQLGGRALWRLFVDAMETQPWDRRSGPLGQAGKTLVAALGAR
jgi:hypothetical protein